MLEAGANCLSASLMFPAIAVLAYAIVPRASSAFAYGLVSAALLWYIVGSLGSMPRWLKEEISSQPEPWKSAEHGNPSPVCM